MRRRTTLLGKQSGDKCRMDDLKKLYNLVYDSLKEHGALPSQAAPLRIGDRQMVETIIDEFICQLYGLNYSVIPLPVVSLDEAEELEKTNG